MGHAIRLHHRRQPLRQKPAPGRSDRRPWTLRILLSRGPEGAAHNYLFLERSLREGHARAVSRDLFAWYNDAHHHSDRRYLTPADMQYGRTATVLAVRHRTRLAAHAAHPERFVTGPQGPETLPTAVWTIRPQKPTREDAQGATIVTSNDPQHGVICRSQLIIDDRSTTLGWNRAPPPRPPHASPGV